MDPTGPLVSVLKEFVIEAGVQSVLRGLQSLRELIGSMRFDGVYEGAEDFWYRGIEAERLTEGAKVKLTGPLSPLAPFMPSHPRAKPGYSAAGWATVSERLRLFLESHRYPAPDDPLESSGYDAMDLVVWGDAVLRSKPLVGRKIYAGLYNIYGKSVECVPVFIDSANAGQSKALNEMNWPRSPGALVEMRGVVRLMPSYYQVLGVAQPIETPELPCYCIEVSRVRVLHPRKSVLYATAWCGTNGGNVVTEFFDYMTASEEQQGLGRLHSRISGTGQEPWFYYDFIECPFQKYPDGNFEIERKLCK